MPTRQTISIIGATGAMGSALARSLSGGHCRLLLFARQAEKLGQLVESIVETRPLAEVEGISCPINAGWEADIIIPAVPYAEEKAVAEKIREVANQKIVISLSNPLNETFTALLTASGTSAAEELQHLLPHAKVVKAFNTIFAGCFPSPFLNGQHADVFLAGNDAEALETVKALVRMAGFHPVVAGDLAASRTLESMQLVLMQLARQNGSKGLAAWKILHEPSL